MEIEFLIEFLILYYLFILLPIMILHPEADIYYDPFLISYLIDLIYYILIGLIRVTLSIINLITFKRIKLIEDLNILYKFLFNKYFYTGPPKLIIQIYRSIFYTIIGFLTIILLIFAVIFENIDEEKFKYSGIWNKSVVNFLIYKLLIIPFYFIYFIYRFILNNLPKRIKDSLEDLEDQNYCYYLASSMLSENSVKDEDIIWDPNIEGFNSNKIREKIEKWYSNKEYITHNLFSFNKKPEQFGHYLAGLIESDGNLNITISGTKIYIKISIAFFDMDRPLAETLKKVLGGNLIPIKNKRVLILEINDLESIVKVINLINGKMRTPKIEALHRLITLINTRYYFNIELLPLDESPILSNAWFTGFQDGDGNFYIEPVKKKGTEEISHYAQKFQLQQRKVYKTKSLLEGNQDIFFEPIMKKIQETFTIPKLYEGKKKEEGKVYETWVIMITRYDNMGLLIDYLTRFPLLSSKYENYDDWVKVFYLRRNGQDKQTKLLIEIIKSNHNENRDYSLISWKHLSKNNIYF